jgi:hypothetical protein
VSIKPGQAHLASPMNVSKAALRWVPEVVAGVLILSVITKLSSLSHHPVITGISTGFDAWLQVLLIAFEAALAITLTVDDRNPAIIRVALALFMVYSAYLCFNYLLFDRTGCGCGLGEQLFATPKSKLVYSLLRNAVILLLLGVYCRAFLCVNRRGGRKANRLRFLGGTIMTIHRQRDED